MVGKSLYTGEESEEMVNCDYFYDLDWAQEDSFKVQLEQEASSSWLAVVSGDSASSPPMYCSQTAESLSEDNRFQPLSIGQDRRNCNPKLNRLLVLFWNSLTNENILNAHRMCSWG